MIFRFCFVVLTLVILIWPLASFAQNKKVIPAHAIAMHGTPKYNSEFRHFDYVNPKAPKGGVIRQSALRTFNTFNPYTIKGDAAVGLGFIYESLMTSPQAVSYTHLTLPTKRIV